MDEAAFGGFDVVFCEGIGDAAEVNPVNAVKGFRVECNLVTHKRALGFQCFLLDRGKTNRMGSVIKNSPIPFQQLRTGTGWPDTIAFLDAPVRK